MHSKKGIEMMQTVIGLVIASIIIIFIVLPILSAGYQLLVPSPDYASLRGYERLWDAVKNVQPAKKIYVPLDLKSGYKITTNQFDSNCIKNCICLCKGDQQQKGCFLRVYKEQCQKGEISLHGEYSTSFFSPGKKSLVALVIVSKEENKIDISGQYKGKCSYTDFGKCLSDGDCFEKFGIEGIGFLKTPYFSCTGCNDNLPEGTGEETRNVLCERYSYYEEKSTEPMTGSASYDRKFSIPLSSPNIAQAKSQCTLDPCGLAKRGYKCEWSEDETAKTATCKTSSSK